MTHEYYISSMNNLTKNRLNNYIFDKRNIYIHDRCIKLIKDCQLNFDYNNYLCNKCESFIFDYWHKAKFIDNNYGFENNNIKLLNNKHNDLINLFSFLRNDYPMVIKNNSYSGSCYNILSFNRN